MDLEGDLGIDSVLRAEIWSEILATEGLDPKLRPQTKVRTIAVLAGVLHEAASARPGSARPAAPAILEAREVASPENTPAWPVQPLAAGSEIERFSSILRTRLAERTGYPADLLGNDVDLEADLGIDSVLRAEIWGEILEAEGLDPKLKPKTRSRTITVLAGVLAEALASRARPAQAAAPDARPAAVMVVQAHAQRHGGNQAEGMAVAVTAPEIVPALRYAPEERSSTATDHAARLMETLRRRLAERTGYPAELLGEDVDLEADLGIDSVLRAEVWGEILEAEGLDPKLKPKTRIRTIAVLAGVLAEAVAAKTETAAAQPAPSPGFRASSASATAAVPVPGIVQEPCILNRATRVPLRGTSVRLFPCKRALLVTGHTKTDEDISRMLAGRGVEIDRVDADELAGDGASLEALLARCDPVIYAAHGGLQATQAKASRQAASLRRETTRLFGAFRALKRHLSKAPRRVIIPVSMDGCFGLESGGRSLLGSFPAGFALSLQREIPEAIFQVIDAGDSGWAQAVGHNLDAVSEGVLVGTLGEERVTIDHIPALDVDQGPLPVGKDDLVVVTGGARGIVFECIRSLAMETGCRLHVLGRTQLPGSHEPWLDAQPGDIDKAIHYAEIGLARSGRMPRGEARREGRRMRSQWEIHRNLGKLEKEGIRATYEACDVRDLDALRKVLRRLGRGGTIRGFVHGAGIQRAALIEDLADDQVLDTVETKILPVLLAEEVLDWDDLRMFVSFGSVTGAFGNEGQTDYALANFTLTAAGRALATHHPQTRVTTMEWTAWRGTGMVSEREARNFESLGLTVLDATSGVDLFLRALRSRAPLNQVSVFNPGSAFSMPARRQVAIRTSLLEDGGPTARFSPEKDAFLDQHRLNGQPVVPGTFVIELFAEATNGGHPTSLEDVNFRRPMWIRRENHGVEVVVEDGMLRALPEQRPNVPARALANLMYATARMADPSPLIDLVPMASPDEAASLERRAAGGGGVHFYKLLDDAFRENLATGPIFRGLKATISDSTRCVGLVQLTPEAMTHLDSRGSFLFNPVASDMAVQVASSWAMERLMVMAIPASVERVEVYRPLTGTDAYVCCRLVSMSEESTVVDLTIREKDSTPCYAMKSLTLRTIAKVVK